MTAQLHKEILFKLLVRVLIDSLVDSLMTSLTTSHLQYCFQMLSLLPHISITFIFGDCTWLAKMMIMWRVLSSRHLASKGFPCSGLLPHRFHSAMTAPPGCSSNQDSGWKFDFDGAGFLWQRIVPASMKWYSEIQIECEIDDVPYRDCINSPPNAHCCGWCGHGLQLAHIHLHCTSCWSHVHCRSHGHCCSHGLLQNWFRLGCLLASFL